MSVSQGHTLAALMPIATIQRGLTTVHVNLDSLGVEQNARVSVTFENIVLRRLIFFNFELSFKTRRPTHLLLFLQLLVFLMTKLLKITIHETLSLCLRDLPRFWLQKTTQISVLIIQDIILNLIK